MGNRCIQLTSVLATHRSISRSSSIQEVLIFRCLLLIPLNTRMSERNVIIIDHAYTLIPLIDLQMSVLFMSTLKLMLLQSTYLFHHQPRSSTRNWILPT